MSTPLAGQFRELLEQLVAVAGRSRRSSSTAGSTIRSTRARTSYLPGPSRRRTRRGLGDASSYL